ncbi:MAG: hypothetical protein DWQ10_04355 [Calditrichaeota bacterium]|nr:MAG: hypothetical protein DWQ10_04355 [Calditrichota bacterium]
MPLDLFKYDTIYPTPLIFVFKILIFNYKVKDLYKKMHKYKLCKIIPVLGEKFCTGKFRHYAPAVAKR